jgi:hypothetical protein
MELNGDVLIVNLQQIFKQLQSSLQQDVVVLGENFDIENCSFV